MMEFIYTIGGFGMVALLVVAMLLQVSIPIMAIGALLSIYIKQLGRTHKLSDRRHS